jgi:hypothetical protein
LSKKQERVIIQDFGTLDLYFAERFNIAPTQSAPVVLTENGKLVSRDMVGVSFKGETGNLL